MTDDRLSQLEQKVSHLEQRLALQAALLDTFSGMIVFNKKVKFNANVYDANGNVVTEINNL
jgi:uncharacterized coiled-coil protein SlyX